MIRRVFRLTVFAIVIFIPLASISVTVMLYELVATVSPGCGAGTAVQSYTPASFAHHKVDTTPYLMTNYADVSFPSRPDADGDTLMIQAFFIPAPNVADYQGQPTVIVVHGRDACRRVPETLVPAGMLNRNGFNVLALDLRNMGASESNGGRMGAGATEYLDVLGALDWLIAEQGVSSERIGVYGYSLGGAAALLATAHDERIHAVWTDSAFIDVEMVLRDAGDTLGVGFLFPLFELYGDVRYGSNLVDVIQPINVIDDIATRPVYITHSTADQIVPVENAYRLEELLTDETRHQTWIVTNSDHVQMALDHTGEYERRMVDFFTTYLAPTDAPDD